MESFSPGGVNTDKMIRTVAIGMNIDIVERVHEQGKNSADASIGTYSPEYMKKRVKKKLGSSTKVVLVYDRQMVNDFSIGSKTPEKTGQDEYGLGFKNPLNAQKAEWMTKRYGPLYPPTMKERERALQRASYFINQAFKGSI